MKSSYIIFVILSISANAINCRAMLNVRNPQLSNIVVHADTLRNEGNYYEAADYYLDAINIKNPIAQQELKENKSPDKSSYSLRLHLIRLLCLEKAGERTSSTYEKECRTVIAKYKNQTAGKLRRHYIAVYQQLLNHYSELHNTPAFNKTLFDILNSEPRYLPFLSYFFINANFSGISFEKLNSVIDNYEKSNARKYPNVDYLKLKILERTKPNTFDSAYDFIKKYPRFEYVRDVVDSLEKSLDKSNPAQLVRYNNALKVLAIKQPVKNTETISFIINKINK